MFRNHIIWTKFGRLWRSKTSALALLVLLLLLGTGTVSSHPYVTANNTTSLETNRSGY
ncbi:hypothetical protein MNBD_CHLOROFLEXI01-979, partial [hydrothermal vent metagenome]